MEILHSTSDLDLTKLNLLIVEDQKIMQLMYKKALEGAFSSCFNYIPCYTIEEAIQKTTYLEHYSSGVHYALLDYSLPDGLITEFYKFKIQNHFTFRTSILTSHSESEYVNGIKSYSDCIDTYMIKPFSIDQLRNVFKKYACPHSQFNSDVCHCFESQKYTFKKYKDVQKWTTL